jgi:hypothetical protein
MVWDPTATVSPSQVSSLAAKAVAQRRAWFPSTVTIGGTSATVVLATVVTERELIEGGFQLVHQAVMRLATSAGITPALRDVVVWAAGGKSWRIAEIRPHPVNPEYLIGLEQL